MRMSLYYIEAVCTEDQRTVSMVARQLTDVNSIIILLTRVRNLLPINHRCSSLISRTYRR